jgi:DNA (cytosine-5)-methyltransferase 1
MRAIGLCAGIGGDTLAALAAGIDVVGLVEWDEFCRTILAARFPDVPLLLDVRKVHGDEFGPVDLVYGGIPCQPYSVAGKRRAEQDERDLWPDAFRLLVSTGADWLLVENVANFPRLALDRVGADLEAAGYEWAAVILPAAAVGAPHLRERCFLVAHCDGVRELQPQGGFGHVGGRPTDGGALAHTHAAGLQERDRQPSHLREPARRCAALQCGAGETQPGVGGAPDGPADWLDRPFPAGRGLAQFDWEPPRTVVERQPHRADRLKALGNGCVPQQVYPLFRFIKEYGDGCPTSAR